MITFNSENVVGVDIDSTLVFTVTPTQCWQSVDPDEPTKDMYLVLDMSSYDLALEDPYGHMGTIYLKKHKPNINLVKRCHAKGDTLFAWSMGGAKWAEAVIKALKMEQFFAFVMSKPNKYIDDKDVETWMGQRQWLQPDHEGSWQSE